MSTKTARPAAADDIDVYVALVLQGASRITIRGRAKAEQVATTLGFGPAGTPGLWRGVLDGADCIVGAQR